MMPGVEKQERAKVLELTFDSELRLAPEVLQTAIAFGGQFGIEPHRLSIVLREMLTNAVVHGNGGDSNLRVSCILDGRRAGTLRVTVRDAGNGFDYRSLDLRLPEQPGPLESRGYKLINAYAEHLEFNDKGNEVTAHLRAGNE